LSVEDQRGLRDKRAMEWILEEVWSNCSTTNFRTEAYGNGLTAP
jgi:hypothetical protein